MSVSLIADMQVILLFCCMQPIRSIASIPSLFATHFAIIYCRSIVFNSARDSCHVTWPDPCLKSDIEAVEKVQRKYTKRLAGFKKLSYDQRLKVLDLPSLELRRLYADLRWRYKIVFGVVDVTRDDFFQLCSTSITRGHMYKLYKPRCTNSKRSHFLHAEL